MTTERRCTCDYLGRGPHEQGCPAILPSKERLEDPQGRVWDEKLRRWIDPEDLSDIERLNEHCAQLSSQHHAALDEIERLRQQLRDIADRLLANDRVEAMKWARGITCNFGVQPEFSVETNIMGNDPSQDRAKGCAQESTGAAGKAEAGSPRVAARDVLIDRIERLARETGDWRAAFERLKAGLPVETFGEQTADEVVSRLYRRFKEWSRRGFGPEDVTWCEVKADVMALIRSDEKTASETKECPSCGYPGPPLGSDPGIDMGGVRHVRHLTASEERSFTETFRRSPRRVETSREYTYAVHLLNAWVNRFGRPDGFEPYGDLYGVLTQIDNVVTGLLSEDRVTTASAENGPALANGDDK